MHRRTFLALSVTGLASFAFASVPLSPSPLFLHISELADFESARLRLGRVRRYVGFANFNLISFDTVLHYARNVSSIGEFSKSELAFLEKLFYDETSKYGFFGRRTCEAITTAIDERETLKIPHSGHYIFKGEPLDAFRRLEKDVGPTLVLTSGVRGVPKQMDLFLNKIKSCGGNLSLAAKSIAPPGHSYHSIGDFDVGKKGLGHFNFTEEFAKTQEFAKLQTLPYVRTRYTPGNDDGVQFEPWHIEIVSQNRG